MNTTTGAGPARSEIDQNSCRQTKPITVYINANDSKTFGVELQVIHSQQIN